MQPFVLKPKGVRNLPTIYRIYYIQMNQEHASFICNSFYYPSQKETI